MTNKYTAMASAIGSASKGADVERQYYQALAKVSETQALISTALVDLNSSGITTSAGAVTRWRNMANRNQAAYFNGTDAYVSTPDSGALALTGAVQTWTIYGVAAADWTPVAIATLAGQYEITGDLRSWRVMLETTGKLGIYSSTLGTGATTVGATSDVLVVTDGQLYDFQVQRTASTGGVVFRQALAGGEFVDVGTGTTAVGTLFNGTTPLLIGAYQAGGSAVSPFTGTIQRFTLMDDTRLAASWDAREQSDYASSTLVSVGPEIFVNGDFSDGLSGWTTAGATTALNVVGEVLQWRGTGIYTGLSQSRAAIGDVVDVTVVTTSTNTANLTISDAGASYPVVVPVGSPAGTYTKRYTPVSSAATTLYLNTYSASIDIESVSVKRVSTYTSTNAIYRDPYDLDTILGTAANLRSHHSGAMLLDGVSGSYASAPDSPANSVTGDCILYGYVQPVDNTPASGQTIISKHLPTGNQRGFTLMIDHSPTAGTPQCYLSLDGTSASVYQGAAVTPYADGAGYWLFAAIDIGTNITFYTSPSAPTADVSTAFAAATQLGSAVAITQTAIFDNTATLEVGAYAAGAAEPLTGQIHRAGIISGILPQGLEFGEDILPAGDWTDSGFGAPLVQDGDTVVILENGADGSTARAIKAITTVVGVSYVFNAYLASSNIGGAVGALNVSNSPVAAAPYATVAQAAGTAFSLPFTATATTTYVALVVNTLTVGATLTWDDSLSSVKPTAAIAVDFNPALAGRSATGLDSDTFVSSDGATYTLHGGAVIQNSGQDEVKSYGAAGLETTVAPALITGELTQFTVAKLDALTGVAQFISNARDDITKALYQAVNTTGNYQINAGASLIPGAANTDPRLLTVRYNKDTTSSVQANGLSEIVGDLGAEDMQFVTLFASDAVANTLTGSIARFIIFDRALTDYEVLLVQRYLGSSHIDGYLVSTLLDKDSSVLEAVTIDMDTGVLVAPTGSIDDVKRSALSSLGYEGTVQDMEKQYLIDMGYTGGLDDMGREYWGI